MASSRPPADHDGVSLAVAPPYVQDGAAVIALASVRRHTATRPRRNGVPGLDAELSGSHPLGAFVVRRGRVRWRPAVDLTRVVTTGELVLGAVLVARRLADRPSGAKAAVVMGPGGWVSMKGGAMSVRPARRGWRRLRPAPSASPAPRRRPWWARLLSATALHALVG